MKFIKTLPLLAACMVCITAAKAQFQGRVYIPDNSVQVFESAVQKTLAWAGGMNNPQPSIADLNNDGKKDLVIYEQYHVVKTFINTGSNTSPNFVYDPYYQATFPAQLNDYVKMVDYNRDNIPDLIHRGASGFSVYKGFYNSHNALDFTFYRDLYYQSPTSGWVNAYCEPTDIPAIEDVDNDGDLDFLAFYIGGGFIYYYRNCQVEEGLPPDSIRVCVKDNCWGKAFQGYWREQQLGHSCDPTNVVSCKGCGNEEGQNKTTHTGNSLCLVDMDGDGDYDYFTGNVSFDDIQYVKNGKVELGSPIDTMIAQDTAWGSNGHKVNINLWPAAFALDVDGDGDKDLLFAPHVLGTENIKTMTWFENTGSSTNPSYTYRTDTYLGDKMLDFGTGAYPVLYDYDKDGKTDLLVGSDGIFTGGIALTPKLAYYRNTGTQQAPVYTLVNADLFGMSVQGAPGVAPAIGDVDNDGKDDLLIGHTDGTLTLYINTAASNTVQPVWTKSPDKLKDENGIVISVDNRAAPCIYDLDKDGKKDLIIGCLQGTLSYYRFTGTTPGQVKLKLENNFLGEVKVDIDYPYGYSTPFIGPMDNTGIPYLIVGSGTGKLYRYDGFQTGNTTNPYTRLDSAYSEILTDGRSAPAFIDFDGDGKYNLISGNVHGGLMMYQQLFNVSADALTSPDGMVKIYPNPANNQLYISWLNSFAGGKLEISLTSVMGRQLLLKNVDAKDLGTTLDVSQIPSGVYYCIILANGHRTTQAISIVK
jgi:hypothetical protein